MTHMMDFPRRVMSLWVQFDQKQLIIMLKCHVPFSLIRLEAIMLTELLFKYHVPGLHLVRNNYVSHISMCTSQLQTR